MKSEVLKIQVDTPSQFNYLMRRVQESLYWIPIPREYFDINYVNGLFEGAGAYFGNLSGVWDENKTSKNRISGILVLIYNSFIRYDINHYNGNQNILIQSFLQKMNDKNIFEKNVEEFIKFNKNQEKCNYCGQMIK